MRLVGYELKKLLSAPVFLIVLALLFIANVVYAEDQTNHSYLEAYVAVRSDIAGLSPEEQNAYLADKLSKLNLAYEIERMSEIEEDGFAADITSNYNEELVKETLSDLENGTLTTYLPTVRSERNLLETVKEEVDATNGYDEYVQNIIKRAQMMIISGTISKNDGFTYDSTQKTLEVFSSLPDIPVSYGISDGVLSATDTAMTDIFCVVAVALAGIFVCRTERDDKLLTLVMPLRRGRLSTGAAKLFTLIIVSLAACLLLCATNYAFAAVRYGFGDISRSIQSIPDFASCPYLITVGDYLVLSIAVKLSACAVWCLIMFAAANVFRRTAVTLVTFVGALGLCALASSLPSGSKLILFKHANPFSFFDSPAIVGQYVNLNFFSKAVGIRPMCIVLAVLLSAAGAIFGLMAFRRMYPAATAPTIKLKTKHKNIRAGSVMLYELKKLFVYRFGIVVLAAAALFQINAAQNFHVSTDSSEQLFQSYMLKLEGNIDGSQDAFIEEERQRIQNTGILLEELDASYAAGEMSYREYATEQSRLLALSERQVGFSYLESYQYSVTASGADKYVYPTGFQRLFNDHKLATSHVMLENLILIAGLASIFAGDFESGAVFFLNPLPRGRSFLLRRKLIAMLLFCVLATVIAFSPDIFTVSREMPLHCWNASTSSLPFLSGLSFAMPIWMYYALLWLTRLLGTISAAMLISAVGCAVKRSSVTMIVSAAVLLIPAAAEKLSFTVLRRFTLLPIQNGTVSMLSDGAARWFAFLLPIVVLAAGYLFIRQRFAKKRFLFILLAKKLLKRLWRKISGKPANKNTVANGSKG